jgi:amino acid transporter
MPTETNSPPTLKRALGLPALVLYGIVLIQPTAPMPLFGAAAVQGQGHVVTALLIGMVAMLFTAFSYGKMAGVYPSSGSAYAYVGRELHPALGYFTGWSIMFDYLIVPTINVIWISMAAKNIFPSVPYGIFAVSFVVLFTVMNLRGIEASARTNTFLTVGLGVVIVLFLGAAVRYLWQHPPATPADWLRPFYDPQTFSFPTVSSGAALAVLTYFGFDGISTLSEEAHNPRQNILRATVLVCLLTGVLAGIQVYAAQLIWPETKFPDVDTAFCYVAGRAGGNWLFQIVNAALLVASIGSGMGAHLAGGRLLYGMGRDNAIPQKFFGALHPRTRIPANNILLIGALTLIGVFAMSYPLGCELVNFGALIAFMGVNLSAFFHFYLRAGRKTFWNLFGPLAGCAVCFYLWCSLGHAAKIAGFAWLVAGVAYGAWRTKFFTRPMTFVKYEDAEDKSAE